MMIWRAVDEIAELSLPHDESVGVDKAETELEAHDRELTEAGSQTSKRAWSGDECCIGTSCARLGHRIARMSVAESAASYILAAESHGLAFDEQAAECQGFPASPIHRSPVKTSRRRSMIPRKLGMKMEVR